jgi:IS30 family transposase
MADAGRSRRPSGSGPETANRELFLRLLGQGLSNSAACRQVGVHRRTGTRWRYGRRAVDAAGREYEYPSIMQPAPTISDRFLSPDERLTIADQLRTGTSLRAIARGLGRSASTVSREVRRNRDPLSGEYRPFTADLLAKVRRRRDREGKLAGRPELHRLVQDGLAPQAAPLHSSHHDKPLHPSR